MEALTAFPGLQQGDVIYIVTDGYDKGSQARPSELSRSLGSAGVRLFVGLIKPPIEEFARHHGETRASADVKNADQDLTSVVGETAGDLALVDPLPPDTGDRNRIARERSWLVDASRNLTEHMNEFYKLENQAPKAGG